MKNSKALANEFNQFFKDKVQKIMDNFVRTEDNPTDQQYLESDYTTDRRFREFIPVNSDKIAKIIRTAPPKSCELDPVPSKILKQVCKDIWKSGEMTIVIGLDEINPTDFAQNLGFYFHKWMKNLVHVNKLTSSAFLMLKQIMRVCHKINFSKAKILVQSLVLSWVDYCNSLQPGTSQYNLKKLERIQNMGARIIHCSSKYDRITSLLQELHWLMIDDCITYKIAVIMYKCVNGIVQKYLTDLTVTLHGRQLHSSSRKKLPVSRFKTALAHNSSF